MNLLKCNTFRSKKYLAFVRGLPCSVLNDPCDCAGQVVPHHTEAGGVGMKCSDAEVIPLCHRHHDQHDHIGKKTFYELQNTTKEDCLIKTMKAYIEGKSK